MKEIKHIAVLTSGGDAPGMNACIRAVVRSAIHYNLKVSGVMKGYQGLIDDTINHLQSRSVSNIIQHGGTILKSARCKEFYEYEGRLKAIKNLRNRGIDALVVIGGDGSFTGANKIHEEFGFKVIGIPGTIDNDLVGTDMTLGYDTATNTVVRCIDTIRDTASSHNRLFFIEVMGKDTGYIAVRSAVAAGAEAILIPEKPMTLETIIDHLNRGGKRKKSSSLVVVAEGNINGGAYEIAKKVRKDYPEYDTKVTILGHLQRGGSPSVFDRVLASRLGVAAVEGLLAGKTAIMVGRIGSEITNIPLLETFNHEKGIDENLYRISEILSN